MTNPVLVLGVGEFGRCIIDALGQAALSRPACGLSTVLCMPDRPQLDRPDLLREWRGGEDYPPHLVLAAHLQESFGRQAWRKLLGQACRLFAPYMHPEITLVLATDSMSSDDDPEINNILDELLEELTALSRDDAPACWCYLLDSRDLLGQPAAPDGAGAILFQAHQAAELALALAGGLAHLPAYRRTSLNEMARNFRGGPAAVRAAALGVCTLRLAVRGAENSDAIWLAGALLEQYFTGDSSQDDFGEAQRLCSSWQEECGLLPPAVAALLRREDNGRPWSFPLYPPDFNQSGSLDWARLMKDWLTGLEKRWISEQAPAARLSQAVQGRLKGSRAWLEDHMSALLLERPEGARTGQALLNQAAACLLMLQHQPGLLPFHVQPQRTWADRLKGICLELAPVDDLPACRKAFEAADRSYRSLLKDLESCRGLARLVKPLRLPHLLRLRWRLKACADQVVEAVGMEYARRMVKAQQTALQELCKGLTALLGEWEPRLEGRLQLLAETIALLRQWQDIPDATPLPHPLLTERTLLPENNDDKARVLPSAALAGNFATNHPEALAGNDAAELAGQLCRFALDLLEAEAARVPFQERAAALLPPKAMGLAEGLAGRYAADLLPCLPLTADERAGLAALLPGSQGKLTPVIPLMFYGDPEPSTSTVAERHFRSDDRGRVTVFFTLHGLDIARLRVFSPPEEGAEVLLPETEAAG